jgi:hypothetical protein
MQSGQLIQKLGYLGYVRFKIFSKVNKLCLKECTVLIPHTFPKERASTLQMIVSEEIEACQRMINFANESLQTLSLYWIDFQILKSNLKEKQNLTLFEEYIVNLPW